MNTTQNNLKIYLNGQITEVAETTLDTIIGARYQKPENVVAELNGKVIARANWQNTHLQAQDRLELLSFVGGG